MRNATGVVDADVGKFVSEGWSHPDSTLLFKLVFWSNHRKLLILGECLAQIPGH